MEQLNAVSAAVETLRTNMNDIASKLPEYPVVLAMKCVGTSLGPQLMAEIGDVTRFTNKGALAAFAGVDPGVKQSGAYEQKSVRTSKRGSPLLRKTLFQIMECLLMTMSENDSVYAFMNKKRLVCINFNLHHFGLDFLFAGLHRAGRDALQICRLYKSVS
ncbi:MAG: IS110 family transposase [Candidatus Scatomorpha sp.]